jgi:hypothetical protein
MISGRRTHWRLSAERNMLMAAVGGVRIAFGTRWRPLRDRAAGAWEQRAAPLPGIDGALFTA